MGRRSDPLFQLVDRQLEHLCVLPRRLTDLLLLLWGELQPEFWVGSTGTAPVRLGPEPLEDWLTICWPSVNPA
jgi:hypothetical protein